MGVFIISSNRAVAFTLAFLMVVALTTGQFFHSRKFRRFNSKRRPLLRRPTPQRSFNRVPVHRFPTTTFTAAGLMPKCNYQVGDTYENCLKQVASPVCNRNDKFRTFDGTCNNLVDTTKGAALTPLRRLLPADYIDGDTPRGFPCYYGTVSSFSLRNLQSNRHASTIHRWATSNPTAHDVSRTLFKLTKKSVKNFKGLSTLFMTFGQFLDHDLALTPHEECKNKKQSCPNSVKDFKYPCFPMKFDHHNTRCTGFARSKPVCKQSNFNDYGGRKREQINMVTAYIDAGVVYGNNEKAARKLRKLDGSGKMKITHDGLLPVDHEPKPDKECMANDGCSLVGDERGDENIALLSMHTLWIREHNRIAMKLKKINPHWNGDELYNNARKIVGASLQNIVYEEYLPNIVRLPQYRTYKTNKDSSIINGFATAAFRYGHSLIPSSFSQLNTNFDKKTKDMTLREAFFNTKHIHQHGIESTMFGLCANQSNTVNMEFPEDLNRKLFVKLDDNEGYDDLSARNIQRGRDHGIPTYGEWRRRCNLKPLKSFYDLYSIMQDGAAADFQRLYKHPNDIDLFAAGIAEKHMPGLIVGETFHCIFREQFSTLRDGDRFFYLNKGVFTAEQRHSLKKVSLAKVLCNNLKGVVSIQRNVFKSFFAGERRESCSAIDELNLHLWQEYRPVQTRKPVVPTITEKPYGVRTKAPNTCNVGDTYENCVQHKKATRCDNNNQKFRTFDGSCNNLKRTNWGATNTGMERMLPASYIDDSDMPSGFPCTGKQVKSHNPAPTSHEVSINLFDITTENVKNQKRLSTLFMTFGQFLDHDLALTPHEECKVKDCSDTNKVFKYPCFPLQFKKGESSCTGFARSKPVCKRFPFEKRNQINTITSFVDAGNVYGNDEKMARRLRTLDNTGKLKTTKLGLLLPDPEFPEKKCMMQKGCSLVGDERCDENIALQAMHTLWVREHNRIADKLKRLNSHWTGETIYQTARKIVGALFQHVTYTEFVPRLAKLPTYRRYDHNINPGIINGFATAAYRFGHSLVPDKFSQLDNSFNKKHDSMVLQKAFFNLEHVKKHGIEPTIMGLLGNQSNEVNLQFADSIARKLFIPFGKAGYDDLMARNIQRGRDHGIPTYGFWRTRCNLKHLKSFSDLDDIMQKGASDVFRKLYKHPNDIDLFAAGMAEKHKDGLVVGPTFSCIIAKQFFHLREGDRFFYLNGDVFTYQQRESIKRMSMAKIICNNLHHIVSIQKDVFKSFYGNHQRRVGCHSLPDLNFELWRERKFVRSHHHRNHFPFLRRQIPY